MDLDLKSRTALVTGASIGIGRAIARGLTQEGVRVVGVARRKELLDTLAAEVKAAGGTLIPVVQDIVAEGAADKLAVDALESDGPVDILVNNAGLQHRAPLDEFPPEAFERLLATNITGVFNVAQACARHMIPRGRGKIVNITSVNALVARATIAPYTATKGAIKNLTRGMCTDWAKHGLQVNAIAPGYFKTPLNQALVDDAAFSAWLEKRTPAGRWGNVEELIGAAVFLSGDASSFVNGHTLYVDGGITTSL